jgi:hypothetical protein
MANVSAMWAPITKASAGAKLNASIGVPAARAT